MKKVMLVVVALASVLMSAVALAADSGGGGSMGSGIGMVAGQVTSNMTNIAKLITAAAYVAGMAFAVGAIVKLKAHKDNPTQVPVSTGIVLLFVAAALIFIPTVFKVSGATMFGGSGMVAGPSGIATFGAKTPTT